MGPSSNQETLTLQSCLSRSQQSSSQHLSSECSSNLSGWRESENHRGSFSRDSESEKNKSSDFGYINCNNFSSLGDILDCNFHDFVSVDAFTSHLDFGFASSNFDFLGATGSEVVGIDSLLEFGNIDTSSSSSSSPGELTTATTPQTSSDSQLSSSSLSSLQQDSLTLDMIPAGDLDSLLSLQADIPLNEYTIGLPLFPTPTPPTLSASPTQESATTGSPTTTSPASYHQSTPSLPPLNASYRIQKTKSKPGPKPKARLPSASPHEEDEDSPVLLDKRFRNNLAAKKYRQKKVDRISELESALADMTKERDELRLLLARKDAEGAVLREVMAKNNTKAG